MEYSPVVIGRNRKKQMELEAKYKDMSEEAILAANQEKRRVSQHCPITCHKHCFRNSDSCCCLTYSFPPKAMDEFNTRELQLQRDMDMLFTKLEEEKEHVRQNQDMTNRILATRIELDTELGILKKKYTSEAREWESKLQAEKVARVNEMAKAQAEVERLKREVEEMAKERNSLSSLFKQSMKVMFGLDE
jgi:hypothetical protein